MTIRINTSETEIYCRYLDADLFQPKFSNTLCNGRLGEYLKDEFNFKNLPYEINISELIAKKIITPSLLIKFPKADKHKVETIDVSSEKLFHPFDLPELKKDFVDKFKYNIPANFELKTHNTGSEYIEYKAYFNYWIGYVLIEALDGYENIDRFLSESEGKHQFFENMSKIINKRKSFIGIFDKLSYYKTARAILFHKDNMFREKSDLLANGIENISLHHLKCDLEELLILFKEWNDKLLLGKCIYQKALEQLKRDIYILFEWLCISSNKDEKHYFEKWSYKDGNIEEFAELSTVVDYEEFELKRVFLDFLPVYRKISVERYSNKSTEKIMVKYADLSEKEYKKKEDEKYQQILSQITSVDDYLKIYEKLVKLDSFEPWLRSFKDLHSSLNPSANIDYNQLRVLDCLLVITIRTEVLIRTICQKHFNLNEFSIKKLFNKLTHCNTNSNVIKTLCGIHQNWNVSCIDLKLLNPSDDIFNKVGLIPMYDNWNELMLYNLKNILKFVTSRNYFAHCSFKDDEINTPNSELATEMLTSCIESVVLIHGYTES